MNSFIPPWLPSFLLILFFSLNGPGTACLAQSVRDDQPQLSADLNMPLYKWYEPGVNPTGVIVAVHGFVMHGGTFNELARHLVGRGFVVYALDLRGYGRRYQKDADEEIDYEKSQDDLVALARALHAQYAGLPAFYVGESLGADMVIRLAAAHPQLVDGLILTSPAIKGRKLICPTFFKDMALSAANQSREIDLTPYIKRRASEDPRIVDEIVNDPLTRKTVSVSDLFRANRVLKVTMPYIRRVPPSTPVLVIQGSNDRTVKANAVVQLISRLRSIDQTVRWLPDYGHVLIETSYLRPETLRIITGWLQSHTLRSPGIESAQVAPGDGDVQDD